jgi:hypothetical protein
VVLQDLRAACHGPEVMRGAGGLSAEQVLRMLVVKQMNGFSYRVLAFHLADSRGYHNLAGKSQPRCGLNLFPSITYRARTGTS